MIVGFAEVAALLSQGGGVEKIGSLQKRFSRLEINTSINSHVCGRNSQPAGREDNPRVA